MNFKKKSIAIVLILIFLFSTLPMSFASDDIEYSIPQAIMDLTIQNNGLLHVKESIDYNFDSSANGVYRDIPLKQGQEIKNLNITTEGAYNSYEIIKEDGKERLKIYLYSDAAKTQSISSGDKIKINITYDFTNVIKTYKDTGELQYKLWGEEWDVDVGQVTANIHFPSKEGIQYWINPANQVTSESWTNNTLTVQSEGISSGNYLELRSIIPLSEFNNPSYAKHIDSNGLEEIKKLQSDYENKINQANIGFQIVGILLILSILIPALVYVKYGREAKISYDGIYEREPPTKDSPALVNSICGVSSNDIGEPDMKGFQATIMDLINRKILSLNTKEETIPHTNKINKSINLKINTEKLNELKTDEMDVINTLKQFQTEDNSISLDLMNNDLGNKDSAIKFQENYKKWQNDFKNTYMPDEELKKYFISKGARYMKTYGIIILILSALFVYLTLGSIAESAGFGIIAGIFTGIIGLICILLPAKVGGRWTEFGKEYYEKWKNFKKYLKDFSLMKENPPESIVIWNEYLVYATALGVAKEVYKAMEMTVYKDGIYDDNDLFYFHTYGGFYMMNSALNTGITTAMADSNDGIGDIGGGSGGGGGGAF